MSEETREAIAALDDGLNVLARLVSTILDGERSMAAREAFTHVAALAEKTERLERALEALEPVWKEARNLVWRTDANGKPRIMVIESRIALDRLYPVLKTAWEAREALAAEGEPDA